MGGPPTLAHGNRGRPPANVLAARVGTQVVALARGRNAGLNDAERGRKGDGTERGRGNGRFYGVKTKSSFLLTRGRERWLMGARLPRECLSGVVLPRPIVVALSGVVRAGRAQAA